MKVLVCTCKGKIKLPVMDLGPDIEIIIQEDLCKKKTAINPNEKIVIAGCSPSLMEQLFPKVNAEFVNLHEHVVLMGHSMDKARSLILAAIAKIQTADLVPVKIFPIKSKDVLVIGGGVAGIEVAGQLAHNGLKIHLLERKPFLGGMVAALDRLYPEGTPYSHTLLPHIGNLLSSPNIIYHFNTVLSSIRGNVGDYTAVISTRSRGVVTCSSCNACYDACPVEVDDSGKKRKAIFSIPTFPDTYAIDWDTCTKCGACVAVCEGKIELEDTTQESTLNVGAIVVATGLNSYDLSKVEEYGYSRLPGVMSAVEFERAVASGTLKPKKVVIICCAGSRDTKHLPYCSKICCFLALKEAKLIIDRYPSTQVYITAMDMRSHGTFEYLYNTLRERGVTFIRGKPSEVIQNNGNLIVRTEDLYTNELLQVEADTVVLSAGFTPDKETFSKLHINLDQDFPILFENAALGNTQLPRGIFSAGAATFPAGVRDTLIDARKAAFSVLNIMHKETIETHLPVAAINEDICSVCRMCIATCPYNAISIVDDKIHIDKELCMGCGTCSITCPSYASQLEGSNAKALNSQIRALVKKGDILALLCKWSAYNATDRAAYDKKMYPENIKIIRIPCSGAVDPSHVMEALNQGAKGVVIGACYPHSCHYANGNFRAKSRERLLKKNLELLGYDRRRVRLEWIGKDEAQKFVDIVIEMNQ